MPSLPYPGASPSSPSGEIGRRNRLKIYREQSHVGSSPTSGTNFFLFGLFGETLKTIVPSAF